MNNHFNVELQAIVARLNPKFRAQRDLDYLRQAGVSCYDDLLAILPNHDNTEIGQIACWLLGRLGDKKAIPDLVSILKNKNSNLRSTVARALGELDAKEATDELITILINEEDIEVSTFIIYTLGLLGEPQAYSIIVSILGNQTKDTKIRGMAAESLADLRDQRAVIPLIMALQDTSVEVRFWSIFSLGELGDPKALPELKRLAETDQGVLPGWWSIRDEALQAIESIESRNQYI